jgi:hypothetical protein
LRQKNTGSDGALLTPGSPDSEIRSSRYAFRRSSSASTIRVGFSRSGYGLRSSGRLVDQPRLTAEVVDRLLQCLRAVVQRGEHGTAAHLEATPVEFVAQVLGSCGRKPCGPSPVHT